MKVFLKIIFLSCFAELTRCHILPIGSKICDPVRQKVVAEIFKVSSGDILRWEFINKKIYFKEKKKVFTAASESSRVHIDCIKNLPVIHSRNAR